MFFLEQSLLEKMYLCTAKKVEWYDCFFSRMIKKYSYDYKKGAVYQRVAK